MKGFKNHLKLKIAAGVVGLGLIAAGLGGVAAVNFAQQTSTVQGARVTTAASGALSVLYNGSKVATTAQAGAADTTVTPSATNPAAATVHLGAVTAGNYLYSITMQSASAGTSIPAGTLNARWTIAGVERTASVAVSAATVTTGNTGGFTILVPGDAGNTPESIQIVFG